MAAKKKGKHGAGRDRDHGAAGRDHGMAKKKGDKKKKVKKK